METNEKYLKGSICLSDITKNLVNEFKGKMYVSVEVHRRQTPDDYGNTHYLCVKYKDNEGKWQKTFIGKLKEAEFEGKNTASTRPIPAPAVAIKQQSLVDDFPF